MPDYPPAALDAAHRALIDAATDFGHDDLIAGSSASFARAALDAAAPLLADACAAKILAHMDAHGPKGNTAARRAWRRQFGIAARVAAGAFTTREESLRQAAEALAAGDYIACTGPEVPADQSGMSITCRCCGYTGWQRAYAETDEAGEFLCQECWPEVPAPEGEADG